ncbi:uncharacterized protein EV422DRAFT_559619 [Fimicolochytrium jonesii]|uniref:uncharacterized protein n=1 Tax=Fimicolochytrium jonesii TaxID=1396493 RepID=UPI0022FEFD40|nr:uncharacterized protein EV422DRAFT_559619 [Fimicolochytrium jonesii]KAI8818648.1 hypothetical protein EV422DRAFT_559619 [Fimicolochytrium jonesii]
MPSDAASTLSLPDQVTLLLTTSPSPFHPQTTLIETVLASLRHSSGLEKCSLTVFFDGYKTSSNQRLKQGWVSDTLSKAYEEFYVAALDVLRQWVARKTGEEYLWSAEDVKVLAGPRLGIPAVMYTLKSTTTSHMPLRTIRAKENLGFALAVRAALQYVQTPYTLVLQHDWAFIHDVPVAELVQLMIDNSSDVKYITFPSVRSLDYTHRKRHNDLPCSIPCAYSIPVTPLFFFYDKPHLCESAHYKENIFGQKFFRRGDFIEDTYGQHMLNTIKAPKDVQGKLAAWKEFGTFMYYPDNGATRILRHVNGRLGYLPEGQKEKWLSDGQHRQAARAQRLAGKDDEDTDEEFDWDVVLLEEDEANDN